MELYNSLKVLASLSFVISLIILISILCRKFNVTHKLINYKKNSHLLIEDSLILDNKRQIILIKYLHKRHLILLGHNSELIIESNIDSPDIS